MPRQCSHIIEIPDDDVPVKKEPAQPPVSEQPVRRQKLQRKNIDDATTELLASITERDAERRQLRAANTTSKGNDATRRRVTVKSSSTSQRTTRSVSTSQCLKKPVFANERTRSQIVVRTGKKGSGSSITIKYGEGHISFSDAQKKAREYVAKYMKEYHRAGGK